MGHFMNCAIHGRIVGGVSWALSKQTVFVLSILAVKAFAAEGISAPQEPERVSIVVRVYNYAAISAEDLRLVKQEVFRVLDRAGVYTGFVDCPPSPADVDRYPNCKPGRQPLELVLRLRPGFPPGDLVRSSSVSGFAFLPDAGGVGTMADVYAGGAEVLAKGFKALEPRILGGLMAHEIGHLLLGTNTHSVAGLMRSPWGRLELDRAAQGCLWFLDEEGKKMRANCWAYLGRRNQVPPSRVRDLPAALRLRDVLRVGGSKGS